MDIQRILNLLPLSLITFLLGSQVISAQCLTVEDLDCSMTTGQYDNVVIGEVSGDAGQSDGCNDGILEIVGPPGTNIGCMVATNSEWAVLIPANTVIPADGVFLIACSSDPTGNCGVGLTSNANGLIADGAEGDFTVGLLVEIDLDVCNSSNSVFYDPAATGFTIDNSSATDGDQIMLFRPNGTPHDGIFWGTTNTTGTGATTVGGSSGNSDHLTIQISGQTYTLGDNDGDGIVNNNPTSVAGGRGDGGNATAVPLLPTSMDCPCNTPTSPGTFTIPALDDASSIWFDSNVISPNSKGCNSSIGRLDAGTSAGGQNGSPSHTDGEVEDSALNPNGSNMDSGSAPGVAMDFGETIITSEGFTPNTYTPTSCGNPTTEWSYTDHPTPGQPNDDPTFVFYASSDQQCTVGDMVTFTVEIYNYQNVSDNTDIFSGTDNLQTGSYVFDPISGSQVTWDTYTVSGETTTMTYATTLTATGTFDFGLVWDDFSNCCGTTGLPNSQASPNECYETETITVEVVAPMVYDCDDDGIADDPQTACMISCDPGPPEPGTININDYISGGSGLTFTLTDDAGINADVINTTGIFTLEDNLLSGPYTVTINDGSGCTATDLVITIADDCEKPPICPTDVVNTGTTPDGALCPGDMIELCLDGTDLPSGGEICWYTVPASDATPDAATDDLLGCVTIPVDAATIPSNTIPVINELLYRPMNNDGGAGTGAFIEIAAAPSTNISGWIVYDPDWSILFPIGTLIPASGFLVVGYTTDSELPLGKSVDVDLETIDPNNIGGSPFNLVNSGELVGLSQPDGMGGFTFVTGVDYDGAETDNITPLGVNAGGGNYDFSGAPFTSGPANSPIGESIGLLIDGDITSGYDDSGDIPNSAGINTGGCPNSAVVMTIPCLTVTLDASSCSGDIFINSIISGVPESCPMGADVGIGSDYSMSCPSATIMAEAFDVCLVDMASINIPVALSGLTSGIYTIGYQIDGGVEQFVTAPGTAASVNILITGPTSGEIKVTLSSVYNDIDGDGIEETVDGECSGTVNDAEVCVNIRPTPTGTAASGTDPATCVPCDGAVTFTFTGNGPFDFEYTIDGGAPQSVGSVSSPYILMNACPGVYDIVSVSDENSCPGTISSNPVTLAAPGGGTPLIVTAQPAAVCNDGTGSVDLTADVTYDPAYSAVDFYFFGVDPNGLPIDVTDPSTFTGFTIASTYTVPADGTTVFALYIDPMSGCPSTASITIMTNASACFTCPEITTLTDPNDPCNGSSFDLTVSELDADLMNQNSGGGPFGIEFKAISGTMPPVDAYMAMGTSLGIVANAALTNADTEATVTGVGGTLASGDYHVCAILSGAPTDDTCRPQVCVSVTVNSVTCSTFPWDGN